MGARRNATEAVIRRADPSESELLTELAMRSKACWGYSEEFMEACRAELSVSGTDIVSSRIHYFVAELENSIVGFYALERLSETEFELEALFVEPHQIGKGHGRRLIEHAKEQAREMGAQSMSIQGDPNAAHFYRAAGGVQIGHRESESIPGRYLPEFRIALGVEHPT